MAFNVPDSAPRIITTIAGQQTILAVAITSVPVLGHTLGLFKLTPQGWEGVWQTGPQSLADWSAQVANMGSIGALINSFLAAINAAIQALFGNAPPDPNADIAAQIQAYIEAHYQFTVVGGVPVFGPKP